MGKAKSACEPKKPKSVPPGRACGVCPPCSAPCNAGAPPTAAEREVAQLTVRLGQVQDSFKRKITECAMLRADVQRCKEETDRERGACRETQARLRDLEARFDGLSEHAHALLRNKEQTLGQEAAARALQLCYREARDEVDELRVLLSDQAVQLQDYRGKFQQATQLVEEQKRQLVALDMDNTRISEQINLEIQSIKVKFQEKLHELAPLPELLRSTQRRLQEAQQAKALAEHSAVTTAQDLNSARERVNTLLTYNTMKPAEKPQERGNEEKLLAMTQQRVVQLTEMNGVLKGEIERQKANVLRLEEAVVTCEKRLQEKMHECAALGGELDRAREDAALAVRRAITRAETMQKCMKATVAELERQLATSAADLAVVDKDRESTKCRLLCQLQRLQENLELAEMRAEGLRAQAAALRRGPGAGPGSGSGAEDTPECLCETFDT